MKVLVTEPADDLAIERAILRDRVTTGAADPTEIEVVIVHQVIVDAEFLDRYPWLRGVVRRGVGFDNVDLQECASRGVVVANVPDYCTSEVADTAMSMILDLVRGVSELESCLREDPAAWESLALPRVQRTSTTVLGVIGAGRIGSAVLRRAHAFGFQRIYCDPAVATCAGAERVRSLGALLERADVVSLHVPANSETRGMIDAHFLGAMKPGSMLVNTARGSLLADDQPLLDALRARQLSGAAFDVLKTEPPMGTALFEAWRANDPQLQGRLRLNPHTAYHSAEASVEVRHRAAEEAARILAGHQPVNRIHPSV